ncbi:PQQ-dependent sugar dehydrogenase [Cellulomonas sp. Sa3CUA2]|uniref:PQQ-dependent sugar dehydrogenase n=1 Tax=Cellulomonas avistercoris TaxID=2762242 RepID=A0ABR8QAY9_9CELL|nr:PQQ-dependent sugar dehydrogenase [Cellulomonas avistercoris]MBD7917439.1 PQQ-dependent sugar dehydrogenase [Cellulomonas avistercoris]
MRGMRQVVQVVVGALAVAGLTVVASPPALGATVPSGFTDALVADVDNPTAIAFTADGRMLVAQQAGRLRVRTAAGTLLSTPALDLTGRLCTNAERGLLGVAVDPDPATRAIYVFYTARGTSTSCPTSQRANPAGAPTNRVSRFVLGDDNTVDLASETILLDGIYSSEGNHNAGDLHVGKDGYLYVTTGDGGCDYAGDSGCAGSNDASRDRNVLNGKVLRVVRTTGAPAPGNPFTGSGTASCRLAPAPAGTICQETFAWGLRNPFRFAFDPDAAGTVFHVNDVGQNAWEEIDLGTAGADYGWPVREGHCAQTGSASSCGAPLPAGMTDPIHDYTRSTGCGSITGGAFVPHGVWPAAYDDAYLFADYVCGRIMMLSDGTRTNLATGLGGAVHLEFGPYAGSQALYYTTYANGGEVRRIAYTGTENRPPTAVVTASPATGAAPLATTLDGSGSADPDGGALTYLWSFGDGAADATTTTPTVRHTYAAGSWTATLRVRDAAGATSSPVTVRISSGNTAPVVTLTSPAAGATFTVGDTIRLTGSATDAQDGTLPGASLSWTVVRVHDAHTHPFLGPVTGTGTSFTAPGPEDLAAAANSYLRVSLTATDAQGVETTVTRDLQPRKVAVTLGTSPAGRTLTVNGETVTGPTTVTSWAGLDLQLAVPAQSDAQGVAYVLDRWSDGSTSATRTWRTPASAATLTATLTASSTQRGLRGTYFDNSDLTGTSVTRIDPTVAFRWGAGAPVAGIGADTFSVRWTGSIVPRYSQMYRFATTSDDGVRLWVDGRLVINQWTAHAERVDTGTVVLTAGQAVPIRLEYYENQGDATIQLRWWSESQAWQVVPAERLRPS